MGFISKLIGLFTGTKSIQEEFNKHPASVAQYVLDKGYKTPDEQRDFCERLEIDYNQLRKELAKLKSVNQWARDLTTVWSGDAQTINFDYQDSDGAYGQRTIQVEEILVNDEHQFYISGLCSYRNEQRHFNVERIKNLTINGSSTNFYYWCTSALEVDPFSFLPEKAKSNIKHVIWEGQCPPTTFTYRDGNRERLTVSPIRLESNGSYKNLIAIKNNGIERTFFVQNIETMLATEGHNKKHFDEWVNDVLFLDK